MTCHTTGQGVPKRFLWVKGLRPAVGRAVYPNDQTQFQLGRDSPTQVVVGGLCDRYGTDGVEFDPRKKSVGSRNKDSL